MKSLSLSSPHIIAMVGMPGVGKTHFADQFAETFAAPFINQHLLEASGIDEPKASEISLKLLQEIMKTKQTAIYEGTTDRRVDRMELARAAREKGYKVLFVWVQTDPATAKQRALKQMPADTYERFAKRFSAPHDSEPCVVISGRHTYATQAKTLLKRLTQPRARASDTSADTTVPARPSIGRIHIG